MEFLEAACERVIIFDGAMGTQLQSYDLSVEDDYRGAEGCSEILCLTRPDVIREIHARYFAAGADVVETNSFGANHVILDEYDMREKTFELNRVAAVLAREVAADFSSPDKSRYVSGSIGPGTKLPSLGHTSFALLEESCTEQAAGLLAGGVDLFQLETCQDLLQVKAGIAGIYRAMEEAGRRIPVLVQLTIEQTGTMLLGTEIGAALVALEPYDIAAIGLNCATGPVEMVEHVRYLSDWSPRLISVLPNAGLPHLEGSEAVYDLLPDEFVKWQTTFVNDMGVNLIGGCCGTTPAYIEALAQALGGKSAPPREIHPWVPSVASLYSPVSIEQETSFLVVGERANAQGSRKFKKLIEAQDWDGMVTVGKEQVKEGAHMVDVCVDATGRDGVHDMDLLVSKLATASTLPLMLDSTEWEVIAAGLAHVGGRPVINSVNLEDGPAGRPAHLFPLAKKFGAAVVCLLIDEEGQARDIEWKMRVAHRLADLARQYGLRNEDLIFDTLTFPLSTGQEDLRKDALGTLEAIRRVKAEIPGAHSILGVSNISFGLSPAARVVLNSVFLHEAVSYGLDAAIVNAKKILPLHKISPEHKAICEDLVYDRRGVDGSGGVPEYDPLKALLGTFQDVETTVLDQDELADLPVGERLQRRIVDGLREGLEEDLVLGLQEKDALSIVNDWLLEGMSVVGELFGAGEMQLPFVLESAETMKAAVAYLEPHMDRSAAQARGTIVLATVRGDVHDIGKNLVDIIFTNNGYDVHNLGIKQPLAPILAKAREVNADAIGLSGLLVKSTLIMRENLAELNQTGAHDEFPILLGGAALTRRYVEQDLRDFFEGRVFYCSDAFEGLGVLTALQNPELDEDFGRVPAQNLVLPVEGQAAGDAAESGKAQNGRTEESSGSVAVGPLAPLGDTDRQAGGVATAAGVAAPRDGSAVSEAGGAAPESLVASAPFVFSTERSGVARDNPVFVPPFLGSRVIKGLPLDEIAKWINETALFRNQWRYVPGRTSPEKYEEILQNEARPALKALLAQTRSEQVLLPTIVYGYYKTRAHGNDLFVCHPETGEEWQQLSFPRQPGDDRLCVADFVRSRGSGEDDYIGLVIATMGAKASETAGALFAADRYKDYLHLHGFSVEMTEALMEYWHFRMRQEWGFVNEDGTGLPAVFRQGYRGGRYSWGYPACPDLAEQTVVAEILQPERVGLSLSDTCMWVPEQSTAAIVLHHPEAKYFVVRDPATGRLLRS